jgi:dTDP-4-amino-4,6-dideoxygalactose transaminase
MDKIKSIANKFNLIIIEDAAQAIDSFYKGNPLGSLGDMGCFSFHETKNIQCGEGGLLSINNFKFKERSEIIWEKGTNRSAFWRGEVDKYNWVDIGSSYLPSEINAAFLYAQLERLNEIQSLRNYIWNKYYTGLKKLTHIGIKLPYIPSYASNNAHMFYLVCRTNSERNRLIKHLGKNNINAVFHYVCLHDSPFFKNKHDGRKMNNAKKYENCLIRLPIWIGLDVTQIDKINNTILSFFNI